MKLILKYFLFIWVCFSNTQLIHAQIFEIDTTGSLNDPMYLVPNYLQGNGVTINNVDWWGSPMQFGVFRNGNGFGLDSGVVMSTGMVPFITNPNIIVIGGSPLFFTNWNAISGCTYNWSTPPTCFTPGVNGYFYEPPSLINNGVHDLALLAHYSDSVLFNFFNPYTISYHPLDTSYSFVGVIEFDFIASSDTTNFEYVYASSNYNSYWPTSRGVVYDDFFSPFTAFVSGQGISGDYSAPPGFPNGSDNFAWIQGISPKLPVSFSTLNGDPLSLPTAANPSAFQGQINSNQLLISTPPYFYIPLSPFYFTGYSNVFNLSIPTIPCETYHIKLVISRGNTCVNQTGCSSYDSGVMLKAKSLSSEPKLTLVPESDFTLGFDTALVEGCGQTTIHFIRNSNVALSDTIHFNILGTATNGVDYTFLPDSIVFVAGDDSFSLTFTIPNDMLAEGIESLIFDVIDSSFYLPCGTVNTNLLQLTISDQPPFTSTTQSTIINCTDTAAYVSINVTSGMPPYSYLWNTGGTFTIDTLQPAPIIDSLLFVTITDGCGNQRIDSAFIDVQNTPLVVMPLNGFVNCKNDSTKIGVNVISGYPPFSYSWFNGAIDTATTVWVPLDTNYYTVTVTDACNRDTTLLVMASVIPYAPLTVNNVMPDTFWCAPHQIVITNPSISGGSGNHILSFTNWTDSVNWFFGSTLVDTTVVLQVIDLCSLDTLTVNYTYELAATGPFKVRLPRDTTICQGDSVKFNALATGGYPPYKYVWDNGNTVNYRWVNIAGTQHYSVSVTDGCSDRIVKPLTVHPKYITAAFNATTPEPLLVELENQSSGANYYLWHFGDGDSSSTENPTHQYQIWDDYTIKLYVEDSLGCFDSTQTFITLPLNIYVPNAFTPNNDEHNNVFEIKGIWNDASLQSFSIDIYDRWGGMVYSSRDIYFKWDGTSNAKPVNSGTYAYVIKVKFLNHDLQTLTGNVNVIQ